jgi:cellulose synthase (UDP-forming)
VADTEEAAPPAAAREIGADGPSGTRPVSVDVFIATYNEEPALLEKSIRDAQHMRVPPGVEAKVYVLDDGRRKRVRDLAQDLGVHYITRETNEGFKAGNLRNAMDLTCGDLIVIFDADTRPFPEFLERTVGYFRDPKVAWVQTPQWFYDLDEGEALPRWLESSLRLGVLGRALGRLVEALLGPVRVNRDLLGNDPTPFYELVQRRRNWSNASFCCGAGSVHRRDSVMASALFALGSEVESHLAPVSGEIDDPALRAQMEGMVASEAARGIEITPYQFHVSEDIFTSLVLHSSQEQEFRSVFHPQVLCKMLSPQDLLSWTIQRFKYAGGTLDIFLRHPIRRWRGLRPWQAIMYGNTLASYLSPIWLVPLFFATLVYLYLGICTTDDGGGNWIARIAPFLICVRVARMLSTWGIHTMRSEQYALASFWLNATALLHVLRKKPVRFTVTPKMRQSGTAWPLVAPHALVCTLFAGGLFALVLRAAQDPAQRPAAWVYGYIACGVIAAMSVPIRATLRKPTEVPS